MKKLLFGLVATIMLSVSGNAQSDLEISNFIKSNEFQLLANNFQIKSENVNQKDFAFQEHDSKKFNIYRLSVNLNNKINFITFFSDDLGKTYSCVFEKNLIEKGFFEHYDENGQLLANFKVKLLKEMTYVFTINDVFVDNYTGKLAPKCSVGNIYKKLKSACAASETCDMLCDLNPSCFPMLFAWAQAYCATH